jgi:DNA-binding protein
MVNYKGDDNTISIGSKPFMNYVNAVVIQFGTQKEVKLISRGKFISKCVDVAEVTVKKFLKDVRVTDIKINSQEFENKEGKKITVSTMDIILKKN